jgi:hypothetical protein
MQSNEHLAIQVTKIDLYKCAAAKTPVNNLLQLICACVNQVEATTMKKFHHKSNPSQISKAQENSPTSKWTKEDHHFPDLTLKNR